MVGAGSVVKSDVPDHAIVVGVPAEQVAWACLCGTTLKWENERGTCPYCRNEYLLEGPTLIKKEQPQ
jgi:UDP-2-acetamido-3-amino-2,3-dideoxy-glucuronate N-acetyltransferase